MKIGILIPATSRGREWKTYKECYLFNNTLKTFILTYDKENEYKFYIGIDREDKIYDNKENKENIKRFISIIQNVDIEFYFMDGIKKGHLTMMWNKLFKQAYDENCDYFFQCGDDIEFKTKGWINDCITALKRHNNIGLTGPLNNNMRILTQSFVSRKHMELFSYYFPPEIINWFCDDWINEVYIGIKHFYPLQKHICLNIGGKPRYDVNNLQYKNQESFNAVQMKMRVICKQIVQRDISRIKK
tara:strand:- start:76 stop:807 length:732 start_codon:yes stop_codon:yes gene_type:complete